MSAGRGPIGARSAAVAVLLLGLCLERRCGLATANSGVTGSAASAIDPQAFGATTPLEPQPKHPLEGVFAGFMLHMVVGGAAEEYQGTLKLQGGLEAKQKKEIIDEVYIRTGEHYATECQYQGLAPPKNLTSIPINRELANPKYFAAYTYAAFLTTWEVIGSKPVFHRFHDRIGGRVFDAVAQYTQFKPNHDMDDIKGMRNSLREFLSQYAKLGLANDAGALFTKGTDKRWKAGEDVTFKVWLDSPILRGVCKRLGLITGGFQDWSYFLVERMFTSYLVEAEFVKEYPDDSNPAKLIQEWSITPM